MTRLGTMLMIAAFMASPAYAGYVHAVYSGTIDKVAPDAVAPFAPGTRIRIDVVYDPARRVDYTAAFTTWHRAEMARVQAVSLADDPRASLTISVGGVAYFTKFDHIRYGTPFSHCDPDVCGPAGLGMGNLPAVVYLNGTFAGIGNLVVNAAGYSMDPDPIADIHLGGFGLDGPKTGTDDFYIGKGDAEKPFTHGLAIGHIDLSTLKITPVYAPGPRHHRHHRAKSRR